jgi:hypothetical protein
MRRLDNAGLESARQSGAGAVVPAVGDAIGARGPVGDIIGAGVGGIGKEAVAAGALPGVME